VIRIIYPVRLWYNSGVRIAVTGGGTGGHVYPAIAVLEAMNTLLCESSGDALVTLWIGTDRKEAEILPKYDIPLAEIDISPLRRSIRLTALKQNIKLAANLLAGRACKQAAMHLTKFQPDCLIGTGGYVAYPACRVASKLGIPLYLIEPNAIPGLVTRRVAKYAEAVFCATDGSAMALGGENTKAIGVPVRSYSGSYSKEELYLKYELEPHRKTIFVTGGSLGAGFINKIVFNQIVEMLNADCDLAKSVQIIHQTGSRDYETALNLRKELQFPYRPFKYLHDSTEALFLADLFIGRAGASSVAEAAHFGLPSIFLPYSHHSDMQQFRNAYPLAEAGAAFIHIEDEFDRNAFGENLLELIRACRNAELIARIKEFDKNAAEVIASQIISGLSGDSR